jgi:hypothetical protein
MSKLLSSLFSQKFWSAFCLNHHPRKKFGQAKIFWNVSPAHDLANASKKTNQVGKEALT